MFRRPLCVGLLFVFAVGVVPAVAGAGPDFARLEGVVREEMRRQKIPGAALGIVQGDRVLYAKGFGVASVETKEPVTTGTLFRLGSTTKMFTAMAVVRLARAGKLRLDEPIGNHIADLPASLRTLTAHQLLSHTAGLGDGAPMFGPHDDAALAAGIRAWKEDRFFARPGQVYSYSNPGYWLAGLLAESVEKKPYADVLADRLFAPLGMTRTTLRPTMAMTYPLAQGHEGDPPTVVRPAADNASTWPAGSIFSCVDDLNRFALAFLADADAKEKSAELAGVFRTIRQPHVAIPGRPLHYGYGLMMGKHRGVEVIEHGGARSGYGSLIRFLPEQKVAIVMLVNRSAGRLPESADAATALFAELQPPERPMPAESQEWTAEEKTRLVGRYTNSGQSVEIAEKDGKLVLVRGGDAGPPLRKLGEDRFLGPAGPFVVTPGMDGKDLFLCLGGRALRKVSDGK